MVAKATEMAICSNIRDFLDNFEFFITTNANNEIFFLTHCVIWNNIPNTFFLLRLDREIKHYFLRFRNCANDVFIDVCGTLFERSRRGMSVAREEWMEEMMGVLVAKSAELSE